MPVFILIINVEPNSNNPQRGEIAGAYVNCLIEADKFEVAEETALKFLHDEQWLPVCLEESWEVTENDYKDNPKGLESYKQVLLDKEKYSVHTYRTEGN